jgi:hypothetical protein
MSLPRMAQSSFRLQPAGHHQPLLCAAAFSFLPIVSMVVTGTYNPYPVALSILVAAFASYTALDLGRRVAATRGIAPRVWLVPAAIAMGAVLINAETCQSWLDSDPPNFNEAQTALDRIVRDGTRAGFPSLLPIKFSCSR